MIEKITSAKKAMSVFVFHESEEEKKKTGPIQLMKRTTSQQSRIIPAINHVYWHLICHGIAQERTYRVLHCIILTSARIVLFLNTIFVRHYFLQYIELPWLCSGALHGVAFFH